MEDLNIALAQLVVHPLNPRPKLTPADVADLVESVRKKGQLVPLLVRRTKKPGDGPGAYEVLDGARRLFALRTMVQDPERDTAYCRVGDWTDTEALEVLLTANQHHEAGDVFKESVIVQELVKQYDGSVVRVAERLGRPVGWVTARLKLEGLSKEWRKRLQDDPVLATWPIWALGATAALDAEVQKEILDRWEYDAPPSDKELRTYFAELTNKLGLVPWGLDDATLVPKAGACADCPKTSLSCPGLFDDGGAGEDAKKATCLDRACFVKKLTAYNKGRVAELQAEHAQLVTIIEGGSPYDLDQAAPKGTLKAHEYEPSKKGTKGAIPAVSVNGSHVGELTWVKPRVHNSTTTRAKPKGEKKEPTLKQREDKLLARRRAKFVDLVKERLPKRCEDLAIVMGLMQAFGVSDSAWADGQSATPLKVRQKRYEGTHDDFCRIVWPGVRTRLCGALNRWGGMTEKALHEKALMAEWIARTVGLEPKEVQADVEQLIPVPKALQAMRAAKGKKPAKKAAAKKKAAPRKRKAAKKKTAKKTHTKRQHIKKGASRKKAARV